MRPRTPRLACALAGFPAIWLAIWLAAACGGPPGPHGPGGDALAVATDPHLIEMETEATAGLVPAAVDAQLAVRIRVSAGKLPGGDRPPLNLTLVLDTSGSMDGEAIVAARDAARDLVSRMADRDRVAIVVFHSTAEVLVPTTTLEPGARARIDEAIARVEARGTTAMAEGLQLGIQQATAGRVAGSIDRIVLLGDGVPNDPTLLPQLVATARDLRLPITALGLGIEFDPVMLGQIALDTGGVYRYLDAPEAVAQVFDDELLRMQQVVGRNLVLELRPGPGVALESMPGLTEAGTVRYAMLGDLSAGEIRDVIVPVSITGRRDGASVELLDAVLTFDDAVAASGQHRRTGYASAKASADAAAVAASVRVELAIARDRARAAAAILHAIALAQGGDLTGAYATLDAAEAEARRLADASGDDELRTLADRMKEVRGYLAQMVQQQLAGLNAAPTAAGEDAMRRAHESATGVMAPRAP